MQKLTTPPVPAVGSQVDRHVRRVVARRDIVGPEWTFYRGQKLIGQRDGPGRWAVWPRRDPLAYLVGVPDELVREL